MMAAVSECQQEQQHGTTPPCSESEVMLDTLQQQLLLINANLNELARRVAAKDKTTLLGPRNSSWRYNTNRPEKQPQLPWDSQLVVEEKETELQRLRESCHKLMATHITHQMKKIKEIEQKLHSSMQARLAREKEERAKRRRPMVRSDLSAIPSPPTHLYKGAYYKLAVSNHCKHHTHSQQKKKQHFVEQSEESPALQLEESTSSNDDDGRKEEELVHDEEPPLQLPPLIPLVKILGAHDNTDKLSQMRYHTELQQISSAQRLLKHMYNTVNTHQTIARSFYKPQLPPPLVPIGGPTVRHRSTASVPSHHPSKLPCRRSLAAVVRTSSSDHHPSSHTATSQLTSEAHSTLPVAPLSAERLLGSTSLSVKESKRPSLLWTNYLQ